jgi:hypothetical protein
MTRRWSPEEDNDIEYTAPHKNKYHMDLEPKSISPGADKLRSKLFQKRKGLRKAQKQILIILIVPLGTVRVKEV